MNAFATLVLYDIKPQVKSITNEVETALLLRLVNELFTNTHKRLETALQVKIVK